MKQAFLDLSDPTNMAPENWTSFCVITGNLVAALRGQEEFRTENRAAYLQEGMEKVWKRSVLWSEKVLVETLEGAHFQVTRRLRQEKKMGAWLPVHLSTVNGV